MPKNKKFESRSAQEQNEGLNSIDVKVPASRWQDKQQVNPAAGAANIDAPESSFTGKKIAKKGGVLKQEVAAEVVTSGLAGGIPNEVTGTYSLSYGGNEGTILGSAAYTPSVGQARSDSRIGKKLDATAKKINYVASEQVEQEFEESSPLAQNPEAVQGYNGTYRNTAARKQKNAGNVPGELLFQRSVDEIKRDQLYFAMGQHVNTANVANTYDTPTYVPVKGALGVYEYPDESNYSLSRGNYANRELVIKFNEDRLLEKFEFVTEDISTTVTPAVADKSSANATVDRNNAEMDRQIMDSKAGDEKADLWTPLARAVKEPTQTVAYLRDIEALTGAEVWMAYKKTAMCHSYQLNRAAKDGLKVKSPMVEALYGLVLPERSSETAALINDPFNYDDMMRNDRITGVAPMMISAFDSTTKYKTKADLLIQPRSFKMHLQTADNNMNPLRVKAEFVQAVNNREVFSTIDREYDPLMPVCISDRAAIIHCYDFNDLYAWDSLNDDGSRNYKNGYGPFKYMYSDLRNNYIVEAAIPLLEGIANYLEANGEAFYKVFREKEVHIPIIHSTCFFSLWSLLVLAATPFILNNRVNSLRDVLYYEKNVEYPFHQLIAIKDANPMNAVNYGNDDYQQPIVVKQMMPSVRATWIMPELFWAFDEETSNDTYKYVLPWYFNQEEFDFSANAVTHSGVKCAMTMPSIRSGSRFAYLDDVYAMSERDLRLCLDRLTDIPGTVSGEGKQGVYKYSQNSDGIPFVTMSKADFSLNAFLSLPREQGYFMVAPYGWLSSLTPSYLSPAASGVFATGDEGHLGQSSYVLKFWHGRKIPVASASDDTQKILLPVTINVNRAEAYKQDWNAYHCTNVQGIDDGSNDYGWVPSLSMLYTPGTVTPIYGKGQFCPFTNGVISDGAESVLTDDAFKVQSLQKALWTRIQMLPMALSPFDFCGAWRRAGSEDAMKVDPFDFLYYFGLAGFRASDYREDVYNRSAEIVNQGFTFLKDPFITDCPVFKESTTYTQSSNAASLS